MGNKSIKDFNHIFKSNIDLNKLPPNLCLSKNKYLYEFLKENPRLINYCYLVKNEENWAVDLLLENKKQFINRLKKMHLLKLDANMNKNKRLQKFLIDNNFFVDLKPYTTNDKEIIYQDEVAKNNTQKKLKELFNKYE